MKMIGHVNNGATLQYPTQPTFFGYGPGPTSPSTEEKFCKKNSNRPTHPSRPPTRTPTPSTTPTRPTRPGTHPRVPTQQPVIPSRDNIRQSILDSISDHIPNPRSFRNPLISDQTSTRRPTQPPTRGPDRSRVFNHLPFTRSPGNSRRNPNFSSSNDRGGLGRGNLFRRFR